jgi:hypothetical protein
MVAAKLDSWNVEFQFPTTRLTITRPLPRFTRWPPREIQSFPALAQGVELAKLVFGEAGFVGC